MAHTVRREQLVAAACDTSTSRALSSRTRMPRRSTIVWPEGPVKANPSRSSHARATKTNLRDCQVELTFVHVRKTHACMCAFIHVTRTSVGSRCFRLVRSEYVARGQPRSRLDRSRCSVLSRPDTTRRESYVPRTKQPGLTGYTRFFRSRRQFLC